MDWDLYEPEFTLVRKASRIWLESGENYWIPTYEDMEEFYGEIERLWKQGRIMKSLGYYSFNGGYFKSVCNDNGEGCSMELIFSKKSWLINKEHSDA